MAPEILAGKKYNSKADIWSIGVMFYELLYGYCPFEERSMQRLLAKIRRERQPRFVHALNRISQKTEMVIRSMLTVEPHKRIDWTDLFKFFNVNKETASIKKSSAKPPQAEVLKPLPMAQPRGNKFAPKVGQLKLKKMNSFPMQ